MKIVVLTNEGSLYGKKVLNSFINQKIKIEAVIVIKQPFKYYWQLLRYVQKRIGIYDALYFSLRKLLKGEKEPVSWNNKHFIGNYREMGIPVFYTKGTNSKETLGILRNATPDLLILGQTGIAGKELLQIPRSGTLNVHPGILPYYRGIDCAKWAIYNDEFHRVGSSVHWVDSDVDTGNIILKQVYAFSGHERLELLEGNLYDQCVSMLTKAISSMLEGRIPPGEKQSRTDGKQYFKMPRKLENIVTKKLQAFLSRI